MKVDREAVNLRESCPFRLPMVLSSLARSGGFATATKTNEQDVEYDIIWQIKLKYTLQKGHNYFWFTSLVGQDFSCG